MKILITGKEGQVGFELQRALKSLGTVVACDRTNADLANPSMLVKLIRDVKPTIIVNAAAYTAVDKAESEPELAMQVNGIAPGILAEETKRLNALLVHYSTDYVFDGTSSKPYTESDPTHPLNVYGRTKLAGEHAIQTIGAPHIILRTSWVYSMRGKNFLLTMLKLANERDQLKIVNDQIGAPTWSRSIANTTAKILEKYRLHPAHGIFHLTSAGHTSWHGFADAIFRIAKEKKLLAKVPILQPIPSSEYPLPAKRPANSVMSNERLRSTFSVEMPTWLESLSNCVSSSP